MFKLNCWPDVAFDTVDAALEFCEVDDLDCTVLDRVGDVVARRRQGGYIEWPVGVFSQDESAQIALLRRRIG